MQLDKQSIQELAVVVSEAVVNALESKGLVGKPSASQKVAEKSAYAKTEALLYNYRGFKRIVDDAKREIDDLRRYGVPKTCGAGGERVQNGGLPHGIVLPEESVESAVRNVERSVQGTVDAIALIDKSMAALRSDPYYKVLEYLYFDGRTQEDIAVEFGVSQVTISNNKSRLVRELSLRIFPNQSINEMLQ